MIPYEGKVVMVHDDIYKHFGYACLEKIAPN